jgi:hypothetical protein
MKNKLENIMIYIDGILVLLGFGLIIANIIHLAMYGDFVSSPAVYGGILIIIYGLYNFIKNINKRKRDNKDSKT